MATGASNGETREANVGQPPAKSPLNAPKRVATTILRRLGSATAPLAMLSAVLIITAVQIGRAHV